MSACPLRKQSLTPRVRHLYCAGPLWRSRGVCVKHRQTDGEGRRQRETERVAILNCGRPLKAPCWNLATYKVILPHVSSHTRESAGDAQR